MTEKPVCFVIAPIGKENSETRKRSRRVLEDVIKPAARRCGYAPIHAMQVTRPGLITTEIIRHIVSDKLVIADLTGGNANVFYELALRHAVRRPIVQLAAEDESLPFNVKDTRTIRFDIDDVESRKKAVTEIVKQIREMDTSLSPLETPISAAGVPSWMPSPEGEKLPRISGVPFGEKQSNTVLEDYLLALESAGATPPEVRLLIKELKENPRVYLLNDPTDDLETAILLVENVEPGGNITGTSSLQHHDADEHRLYRRAVNDALKANVKYCKIICSSSAVSPQRHEKWMEEFADKADLIRRRKIKPTAFRLLHYPFPMSVDVLISRDKNDQCQEMVAGFAGGEKHGGFRTKDKEMVAKWLDIYVEEKVMVEAERHTTSVLENKEQCPCSDFLRLLEDARRSVATPSRPSPQKSDRQGRRAPRKIR